MKRFNVAVLCILLSFVLLLVACGGGEGGATTGDQQQTDTTQGSEVTDAQTEETRNPADAEFDPSIFANDNEVMYTE